MLSSSPYPDVDIPDVSLWSFLFDGKHRDLGVEVRTQMCMYVG